MTDAATLHRIGFAYQATIRRDGGEITITRRADGSQVGVTVIGKDTPAELRELADAIERARGQLPLVGGGLK